jgi:hypothetical protein
MSLQIEIPEPLAEKVEQAAQRQGRTATDVVLDAVAERLDPLARLDQLMAPVYQRIQELGISEDEAVEDFEAEKHALRRERRAAGQ